LPPGHGKVVGLVPAAPNVARKVISLLGAQSVRWFQLRLTVWEVQIFFQVQGGQFRVNCSALSLLVNVLRYFISGGAGIFDRDVT
jgi:hypothetical protein